MAATQNAIFHKGKPLYYTRNSVVKTPFIIVCGVEVGTKVI